ncbi:RluA family pseudouridine synthase [Kangiella sp.]|uniref:RluA family pseudouridine synthase n=1 Tax=Kangiella sp. TaxID=1920245 RepID=UPI003A95D262
MMMTEPAQNTIIEQHINLDGVADLNDTNPLELLVQASGLSKQKVKDAMTKGAVWLSHGKQARPLRRKNARLRLGEELHLYYNEQVLSETVANPELIADEGDYSVWNKPYGVWSQGSRWGDHCSIGRLVEEHFDYNRQTYVVHRLDRAARGLIILAHNKEAAAALSAMFAKRTVEKHYLAWVQGQFPNESITIEKPIDNKPAKSIATLKEYDADKDRSLLSVQILTGRKHQIRIHLASQGFPIIGDRQHGQADDDSPNLQLIAYKLMFQCPISGEQKEYCLKESQLQES